MLSKSDLGNASAKPLKRCHEVIRQRRSKAHFLSGTRMRKRQSISVQCLPVQAELRCGGAVDLIPEDRMFDIGHMYTDLMRASCFKLNVQKCFRAEPLQNAPVRDGMSSVLCYCHPFSIRLMSSDRRVNGTAVFL